MRNLFALAFHLITLNYASFKLQLTGLFGPHIQDKISGYNETRVIELMTDIYGVLTRFGYFDEDEIRYPPPEGHHLNFSQVPSNVTFDPRVVSLMRKLPAPPTPDDRAIFPMMRPGDYLNAESLAESRDIDDCSGSYQDWSNHPERPYNFFNAGPTELRLLQGAPDATDEPDLVLNVANNSVTYIDKHPELNDPYVLNQPNEKKIYDYECDHRNRPSEPAMPYLERASYNLQQANWIPWPGARAIEEVNERWTRELRRILVEDYDWFGEFREVD